MWLTLRQSGERLPESRCFVEKKLHNWYSTALFPLQLYVKMDNQEGRDEQALVSLKLKKPVDAGLGRTFAVRIEVG